MQQFLTPDQMNTPAVKELFAQLRVIYPILSDKDFNHCEVEVSVNYTPRANVIPQMMTMADLRFTSVTLSCRDQEKSFKEVPDALKELILDRLVRLAQNNINKFNTEVGVKTVTAAPVAPAPVVAADPARANMFAPQAEVPAPVIAQPQPADEDDNEEDMDEEDFGFYQNHMNDFIHDDGRPNLGRIMNANERDRFRASRPQQAPVAQRPQAPAQPPAPAQPIAPQAPAAPAAPNGKNSWFKKN